jgi:NADPH2:quinone reductase
VVDEIGAGVSARLRLGDRVIALVNPTRPEGGAYAEMVVLPERFVAAAPAGSTHAEAATLPLNGLTARLALDCLALKPGHTVAITGAAGAVGGYAVQLAKADGLWVIADASSSADEIVKRGSDVGRRIRQLHPRGVDGAVDAAALGAVLLGAVRDGGAVAVVRGDPPSTSERGISYLPVYVHDYDGNLDKLDQLRGQAETAQLTLRVARVFAYEDADQAHRLLEAGGTRGRLVLNFGPSQPGR